MISKINLCKSKNKNPYLNLAIEEFLTFHTEKSECILYLWQNENTVVIGKNQNCWHECNLNEMKASGGHLARRMSGGGAVFHDLGNVNFTFCLRKDNYNVDKQLQVIVDAVNSFGLNAVKTGRNDITIDGKKFSGNAFFKSGEFCYHHGTIMLDVNREKMSSYLNVSKEKLASKGVESVKSRVVNLKDLCPQITVELLQERLINSFSKVYGLEVGVYDQSKINNEDVNSLEEKYKSWDWIYGRKLPFAHNINKRFSWGSIQIQLQIDGGVIKDAICYSDSLEQEFISEMEKAFVNCKYDKGLLKDAVVYAAKKVSLSHMSMVKDICLLIEEDY